MAETGLLLEGLGFPESLRWHDGRVWLCNWGSGEVLAVTPEGESEVMANLEPRTLPFSIDWLPNGQLLIVDGPRHRLLREVPDRGLLALCDLEESGARPYNELVADGVGNAYVNGGPGEIVLVRPGHRALVVARDLAFPNGMALLDDGRTLVVADSHRCELLAFAVEEDGSLSGPRTWARLDHAPDGICVDSEGAVWAASVPGESCVRVQEGGRVLRTIAVGQGCFSCMLGGEEGRTLYIGAAVWRGMEAALREGPGRTGRLLAVPNQPAPHAGRP